MVKTGKTPIGLRYATSGDYRILAYAEGGYCLNRRAGAIGWVIAEDIPEEIERELCAALGIEYVA